MVAAEQREGRPPDGSGKAAQAVSKREQHTIMGRVRKAWRLLSRLKSATSGALFGHGRREQRPASVGQQAGQAPSEPRAKESTAKVSKSTLGGKGRFRLLTLDELEALPDPEWLIKGILPQCGLAVLYGEPGAGKSFLALDWGMSIASGQPWFGRGVKSGAVVYIYAEGVSGLKYRARVWRAAKTCEPASVRFLPEPVDFVNGEDGKVLVQAIREAGISPSLVIIDTLARCFGSGDENATRDMNAFVSGADQLRAAFPGATVLVVHHLGKDRKKRDRGSTALRGGADAMMLLEQKHKTLILSCDKQKDAEEFKTILLRLQPVDVGKGRTSCVIEKGDAKSLLKFADPRALKTDAKALEALRQIGSDGAHFADWWKASGLPKSTFQDARKRLVERGEVVQEGNRYRVPGTGPEAGTGSEQGCPATA